MPSIILCDKIAVFLRNVYTQRQTCQILLNSSHPRFSVESYSLNSFKQQVQMSHKCRPWQDCEILHIPGKRKLQKGKILHFIFFAIVPKFMLKITTTLPWKKSTKIFTYYTYLWENKKWKSCICICDSPKTLKHYFATLFHTRLVKKKTHMCHIN